MININLKNIFNSFRVFEPIQHTLFAVFFLHKLTISTKILFWNFEFPSYFSKDLQIIVPGGCKILT